MPTEKAPVSRAKKINKKTRQAYTRVDVWRPAIIGLYNKAMGGTDSIDQRNSYYENFKRAQKWPGRISQHFFQTSMTNAYILFNLCTETQSSPKSTLLDFMVAVIQQLSRVSDDFHENTVHKVKIHTPKRVKNNDRRACAECSETNVVFSVRSAINSLVFSAIQMKTCQVVLRVIFAVPRNVPGAWHVKNCGIIIKQIIL